MKVFIPSNVPSSKNSKVWTGKFLVSSKATQRWKKNTAEYWELFRPRFVKALKIRKKPYKISFKFIRDSRRRFDYVNPLQTVQDEMVEYGWLEDDNADELIPVFEKYEYDKKNPGVWITIL